MIAVILMILPLTVAWAEDETQVEIPYNIERLFEKSDKDNRNAVSDLIEVIAERNEELKEDVDKKLRRHKGLEAYKAAAKNGASNEDIIASPLASAEVKEVAAVYLRLDEMSAMTVADYMPEVEEGSVDMIFGQPKVNPIGRWSFAGSWIEFKNDGTYIDGWGSSGSYEIDGTAIKWKTRLFGHTLDNGNVVRSDGQQWPATKE